MEGQRERGGRNESFFEGERVNFCPAFINKFGFIHAARRYVIINNWPRGYLSCIFTAQVARELIKFDTLQGEFRIDFGYGGCGEYCQYFWVRKRVKIVVDF